MTIHYLKDTKKFWRNRSKARKELDGGRANEAFLKKIEISNKLRADAEFLKTGKIVRKS